MRLPVISKIYAFAAITITFLCFISGLLSQKPAFADEIPPNVHILAFGDSLTAGYGLPPGAGFTDQLQVWLTDKLGEPVSVVNGGVSGDTSSGGLSRLDWGLAPFKNGTPDLVILELGANDALRGVSPDLTHQNMDAMLKKLTDKNIPVLLAGMLATPSWGEEYGAAFNKIYPDLAAKYGVAFYPFFLDGVAADPALNQADGMHPNEEGVAIIVNKIGPLVIESLSRS